MTDQQIKALPELLKRSQVRTLLGLNDGAIDCLRLELVTGREAVPMGKLGAVRGLARANGRKGGGYWRYRRADVFRILGR